MHRQDTLITGDIFLFPPIDFPPPQSTHLVIFVNLDLLGNFHITPNTHTMEFRSDHAPTRSAIAQNDTGCVILKAYESRVIIVALPAKFVLIGGHFHGFTPRHIAREIDNMADIIPQCRGKFFAIATEHLLIECRHNR